MRKQRAVGTWLRHFMAITLLALAGLSAAQAQDAAALMARHTGLSQQLQNNVFQRPLVLVSEEAAGTLQGDIYAEVKLPYSEVGPALRSSRQWCDILILHLNVKGCQTAFSGKGDTLSLDIGRKSDQPLAEAYRVDFRYQVVAARRDYLHVSLGAASGPLGTRDYRIELEVVALGAVRSFMHMSYTYAYGLSARVAMRSYLATVGRNKVGFSVVGRNENLQPIYMDGMRGVIERNTMRYYLAIESYLGALSTPASLQVEKRLSDWFTGIERYPRQLHELDRDEYLSMKRREIQRQVSNAQPSAK